MYKTALLALVGVLSLAACNRNTAPNLVSSSKAVDFTNLAVSGYASAAGKAEYADLKAGDRYTVLTVTGLKASTSYLAHYHARGTGAAVTAATSDCKSNGPVVGGMIGMAMTSDASGKLVITGLQATSALSGAAYINVHEAADLAVVPVCADI